MFKSAIGKSLPQKKNQQNCDISLYQKLLFYRNSKNTKKNCRRLFARVLYSDQSLNSCLTRDNVFPYIIYVCICIYIYVPKREQIITLLSTEARQQAQQKHESKTTDRALTRTVTRFIRLAESPVASSPTALRGESKDCCHSGAGMPGRDYGVDF